MQKHMMLLRQNAQVVGANRTGLPCLDSRRTIRLSPLQPRDKLVMTTCHTPSPSCAPHPRHAEGITRGLRPAPLLHSILLLQRAGGYLTTALVNTPHYDAPIVSGRVWTRYAPRAAGSWQVWRAMHGIIEWGAKSLALRPPAASRCDASGGPGVAFRFHGAPGRFERPTPALGKQILIQCNFDHIIRLNLRHSLSELMAI